MKTISTLFICFVTTFSAFSQKFSAEEEFTGPFPSWINIADRGAAGNGIVDETSIIQGALDEIGNDNSSASVVYIPPGVHRITRTLKVNYKINVSLIGADPATTKITWDGSSEGTMLSINGTAYSRFNRLTWDGKKKAGAAIDQSWDASKPHFDTGNEYADNVFTDVGTGIRGGFLGHGFAETAIIRCRFIRNTTAGVSLGNFNALDIWIWNSLFEDCKIGVTNSEGAGNFKVYKSIFKNSLTSDILITNTGEFSFRDNTSVNSQAFIVTSFTGNPALISIQGNTILDPIANTPIEIKNQGPVTFSDNIIRSRSGVTGPVVVNQSWPSSDFFSIGNTYSVSNPVQVNWSIVLDKPTVSSSSLNHLVVPDLPATPQNLNRKVYEVPSNANTTTIQNTINKAANSNTVRPIVHFAHGIYFITSTLTVPAGSDMQLVGDGHGDIHPTLLRWAGDTEGPVLKIVGPSKSIVRDLAINGNGLADNIQITSADQQGARVFMHEMEARGNQINLLVNGLDHTRVLAYNSGFAAASEKSVNVIGGPLAAVGKPKEGRTILFAGAASDNHLSHEVSSGGNLLIRDVWYESAQTGPYLNLTGGGTFAVEGSHITSPLVMPAPQISVNDYSGKAVFLGTYLSDRIAVSGNGASTELLGLSILSGHDTYINDATAPEADIQSFNIRAVDKNSSQSGSGSYTVDNIGVAKATYLTSMLDIVRNVHVDTISNLPVGITDVRFYRVWSSNGINGIELQGVNDNSKPSSGSVLLSVNVSCSSGSVNLNWETSTELNSTKFYIEKSSEGINWVVIDSIPAAGISSVEMKYSYIDRNTDGTSFYRIVLRDLSEKSQTSTTIKPDCPVLKDRLSVSPNPVHEIMTLRISASVESPIYLNLYNSTGSLVKKVNTKVIAGDQEIKFNLGGIADGIYMLQSYWKDHTRTYQIIKQR